MASADSDRDVTYRTSRLDGTVGSDAKRDFEGRIINVTFSLPFAVEMTQQGTWELHERCGNPLFDSFSYLVSADCSWNQILVAWTGRIQQCRTEGTSSKESSVSRSVRSSDDEGWGGSQTFRGTRGISVAKLPQDLLQSQLNGRMGGKVLPVWLFDSFDKTTNTGVLKNQMRWSRYAEQQLHPLLHYKQPDHTDGFGVSWWADYCIVNETFANRIVDTYKAGDVILIHDYHLCLLPALLRQRLPNATIVFYLHTPFPSNEILRCLIRREEVLQGMLGATLVGFQREDFAQHFVSSCRQLLGFVSSDDAVVIHASGARTTIGIFPVGIDADKIHKMAFESAIVASEAREIAASHRPRKIVISRDQLDPNRGVVQKLQAFDVFLQHYPEWRDQVVLIQLTGPPYGANECDSDPQITSKVSDLSAKINGRFGNLRHDPVQVRFNDISEAEYLAYLRAADTCLVTSLRDGMNTTALDYIVCQYAMHGPLILSDFSGNAESLTSAIKINPWDLEGVAAALHSALIMSDTEKASRHSALYEQITKRTVQTWTEDLLDGILTLASNLGRGNITRGLCNRAVEDQYQGAGKRLFMLDYDGTLTPIVKDPEAATPSTKLLRALQKLASDDRNNIWIISGRDKQFLDRWLGGIQRLGLSAEHGSFIRLPMCSEWQNMTERIDMTWQDETMRVFKERTNATPKSVIERKQVALTWHYRLADEKVAHQQVAKCRTQLRNAVARYWDVDIISGKANIEVRPTFVNKGEIVKRLLNEYGKESFSKPEFILCLGDDSTDEDMFGALNAAYGTAEAGVFACTVGDSAKATLAGWHLAEPEDVVDLLETLSLSDG